MVSYRKAGNYYAVLLAGGYGSRFWPLSRVLEPKQFLSLLNDKSLFEKTVLRVKKFIKPSNFYIVTSELYRFQVADLSAQFSIPQENIIFEPQGKNTAAPIAVASQIIYSKDPEAVLCVLPCDHRVENMDRFSRALNRALSVCGNSIAILGIPPLRPATGYGYIKAGTLMPSGVFKVDRFCEKPDHKRAEKFVKSKKYFWNSGIFVASAKVFLNEFKRSIPQLYRQVQRISTGKDIGLIWGKIKPVSFDYGILEKTKNIIMVKAGGIGWSDLGSWQAWDEILKKDHDGNLFQGDVVNLGSKNTTAIGNHRLLAAIGLNDLIVVDTPDAILITKKDKSEEVKKVVDLLICKRRKEHYEHTTVRRPWGSYLVLDSGKGFKVKLVTVSPGSSLSLQYHRKRSEHWVVVEGRAKIIKGSKIIELRANESTYVPVGCKHRLSNSGSNNLKLIEIQSGKFLGEEDIVRLKDNFGRIK